MDRLIVKELIQGDLNSKRLKTELDFILNNNKKIITNYNKLIDLLDKKGASKNAAELILKSI